jgi:hypothetical protein
MKQRHFWLKLVGAALLLHIVLIILSVLEVVIYSHLINPGHGKAFYETHAGRSAPWISYIFGPLFIFFLVKRFIRRFKHQHLLYSLALPIVYAVIDYILFSIMTTDGRTLDKQFVIGKTVKASAGLIAYFIYTKKNRD